jgi:hypothetical protein
MAAGEKMNDTTRLEIDLGGDWQWLWSSTKYNKKKLRQTNKIIIIR